MATLMPTPDWMWREWARVLCGRAGALPPKCQHIPAESVRDDGVRLCAICHEPVKENTE